MNSSMGLGQEMATWIQRKEEEKYFTQLDQMLVQRLQNGETALTRPSVRRQMIEHSESKTLNEISIEINEELDRLENLINETES